MKVSALRTRPALNWSAQWYDRRQGASLDQLTNAAMALFIAEPTQRGSATAGEKQ